MLSSLTRIKIIHTVIWVFFNVVIFYMLYAAITNRLDWRLWTGYGLIVLEGMVLLTFNKMCPLTLIARKYSRSARHNFDIYLPEWLARYNKLIYTLIVIITLFITLYQLYRK
jgi:NhaP-type Na+/H+ or K+/H+ antiporter